MEKKPVVAEGWGVGILWGAGVGLCPNYGCGHMCLCKW